MADPIDAEAAALIAAAEGPAPAAAKRGRGRPRKDGKPAGAPQLVEKASAASAAVKPSAVPAWGADDLDMLGGGVASILAMATLLLVARPTHHPELELADDEAEELGRALARIFARHVRFAKQRQGDVADLTALIGVLGGYGLRVAATLREPTPVPPSVRNAWEVPDGR